MTIVHFDPVQHPRDRLGQFRKALRALKSGDTLRMPGGVSVERRDQSFRIHAPFAKTLDSPVEVKSHRVDTAMRKALDRSALTPHPKTLGGMDSSTYGPVRQSELEARARDPVWKHIPPEDEEDLFTRPHHGDPADNEKWLNDIKDEATQEMEDIEGDLRPVDRETGYRDFRSSSDEERYFDAQDRLDRANAALKRLNDDAPDELPAPPKSVGTAEAPIGRLHTLADYDYTPIDPAAPHAKIKASPGTKFDVLRDTGGLWVVRTPEGKLAVIPKEEPYHRDRQTPFFHEDFFPQ